MTLTNAFVVVTPADIMRIGGRKKPRENRNLIDRSSTFSASDLDLGFLSFSQSS